MCGVRCARALCVAHMLCALRTCVVRCAHALCIAHVRCALRTCVVCCAHTGFNAYRERRKHWERREHRLRAAVQSIRVEPRFVSYWLITLCYIPLQDGAWLVEDNPRNSGKETHQAIIVQGTLYACVLALDNVVHRVVGGNFPGYRDPEFPGFRQTLVVHRTVHSTHI